MTTVELKSRFDVDGRFCVIAQAQTKSGKWARVILRAEISDETRFTDFVRGVRRLARACKKTVLAMDLAGVDDFDDAMRIIQADEGKLAAWQERFGAACQGGSDIGYPVEIPANHPRTADGDCLEHGHDCTVKP